MVPVYHFGERNLYTTHDAWGFRFLWYSIPVFYGRMLIFPKRTPIRTVIGQPIVIPKKYKNPSRELIDEYHGKYKEALLKLHADHAHGEETVPLKVIK